MNTQPSESQCEDPAVFVNSATDIGGWENMTEVKLWLVRTTGKALPLGEEGHQGGLGDLTDRAIPCNAI